MTDLTAADPSAPASIGVIASTDDTSSSPTTGATISRHIVGTANSTNTSSQDQLTIRHRTRAGVPRFDLDGHPDADHVVFDKLHYHVRAPIQFASIDALNEFLELVGNPTIHDAPFWNCPSTPIINSAGASQAKLRVAKGWHIAGNAGFQLNQKLKGQLVIDLDLNFSRWAGALLDPDPSVLADIPATELLRKTGARRESTLDGNDNVLPNRNRLGSPAAEPRVMHSIELVEIYLNKVEEPLRHFLLPSPDFPMVHIMEITAPVLPGASSAEAYLEFYSDDAIATVERLRSAAIAGMSNPEWRYFVSGPSVDGAMVHNSPFLTLSLNKSVKMAIYAKHPTTVRVEVRYLRGVRDHAFHRSARGCSRTPTDELAQLRDDAAKRIKNVLSAFAAHLKPDLGKKDGLDLLLAIQAAFQSEIGMARALLSAAISLGGITETNEEGIAPPRVVRSLERASVLQRVPYRHGNAEAIDGRRFALTPAFAAVARSMLSS